MPSILEEIAAKKNITPRRLGECLQYPPHIYFTARTVAGHYFIVCVCKSHKVDFITASLRVENSLNWDELSKLTREDIEHRAAHASWGRKEQP